MLLARLSGTAKDFLDSETNLNVLPEFRDILSAAGIQLSSDTNAKILICVNHNDRVYKEFVKNGGIVKNAILIRLEPDAVYPKQYTKNIESKYGLIISPGTVGLPRFFRWPYKYHLNPAKPDELDPSLLEILGKNLASSLFSYENWIKRENLLTMVASNKVSPVRSANYALRRELARTLPASDLSVYGGLWTESIGIKARHRIAVLVAAIKQGTIPNFAQIYGNLFLKYSTAKGQIEDKHELLKQSKFSLVIENSNQIITEKIFDSLINGCIPIYVGGNLKCGKLPPLLAYQMDGSAAKITKLIHNYSKEEIELKLGRTLEFLMSADFLDNWLDSKVYEKIGLEVSEYILEQNEGRLSTN
jgi:hypothetical protein